MESQKTKILLEKYWEGSTSIEEETQLRILFKNGIPKEEQQYELVFDYQAALQASESTFNLDFLDKEVESMKSSKAPFLKWLKPAIGIAAAILVMFGSVAHQWKSITGPQVAQESTMDTAYEETVAALAFLSEKLNKGNATIYELSTFDQTTKQVINEKF